MAASANQEGVEGTDSGEIWIFTNACVILGVCPPCQELLIFLPSKETHFGRFYNDFPPSVCKRLHTDRLLLSRCASRGCDTSKSADWQASYDLLSSDFQRQLGSERQYAAAAGQFNGSRGGVVDCTISSLTENGSSASAVVQTTYGDRSTAIIDFALVDENSVWKIRNFAFRQ